jgi:hypothetical protein
VEVEGISGPSFLGFGMVLLLLKLAPTSAGVATMNTPGYPRWSQCESDAGLFCLYFVLFAQTPKFICLFIFNSLKKY